MLKACQTPPLEGCSAGCYAETCAQAKNARPAVRTGGRATRREQVRGAGARSYGRGVGRERRERLPGSIDLTRKSGPSARRTRPLAGCSAWCSPDPCARNASPAKRAGGRLGRKTGRAQGRRAQLRTRGGAGAQRRPAGLDGSYKKVRPVSASKTPTGRLLSWTPFKLLPPHNAPTHEAKNSQSGQDRQQMHGAGVRDRMRPAGCTQNSCVSSGAWRRNSQLSHRPRDHTNTFPF